MRIIIIIMRSISHSMRNAMRYRVVFIRHGESEYNQLNRFTGWQDVKLTKLGIT